VDGEINNTGFSQKRKISPSEQLQLKLFGNVFSEVWLKPLNVMPLVPLAEASGNSKSSSRQESNQFCLPVVSVAAEGFGAATLKSL
jgi:hypothetical protein